MNSRDWKSLEFKTIGIPLEFNGNIEFFRHFGFGFSVFTNLNTNKIYTGAMVKIMFGEFNQF